MSLQGGVRDVARIHYPSCTDSITPNMQISCYFVMINVSEGSLFSRISAPELLLVGRGVKKWLSAAYTKHA
jgi:hypothetical protein